MAAPAPAGPGAEASAVLDELTRNFTYWAPGAGNGSLSSAWYRRNQVRAARPRPAARRRPRAGRAAFLPAQLDSRPRTTPGRAGGTAGLRLISIRSDQLAFCYWKRMTPKKCLHVAAQVSSPWRTLTVRTDLPPQSPLETPSKIHLFGVLLAILGNLVISISLNIQKYSHLLLAQQEHPKPYFKSVLWWGGVLLMAVGETGNFAAYGVAPITLIAPLGCMSVTGSAIISVMFLKENLRASDLLGMTLAFAGTYLLVNFAPNVTQAISARTVQYYFVGWQFLVYVILEILVFCILLYFHKRRGMKHIAILLTLVALLASLTVISVKAVSGMITFSMTDKMQLTYPIFYIMFIIMIASCVFQVKFLSQATKLYTTTTVVPVNHVFFTTSAIVAGVIFYQEFLGAAFLAVFIYLFGCFLSFLGVFLVTRNREKEQSHQSFIDFGNIPGKQMLDKIQPDSNGLSYGTLPDGSDSTKSQSGEKKEV